MNKDEFIKLCVQCGYSNEKAAQEYAENNPKKEYTEKDFMDLYHTAMHWDNVSNTKGLRYVWGLNGKTTAYSNGIIGNSSGRQDWN